MTGWLLVDVFAVRYIGSHEIIKFFASFAEVLNTTKGTLNEVYNISGGARVMCWRMTKDCFVV